MKKRMTPDATRARVKMAKTFTSALTGRGLTQTEAARALRDAPSQLSLVATGKLKGFSVERLMSLLARAGHDITITATPRADLRNGAFSRGSIDFAVGES